MRALVYTLIVVAFSSLSMAQDAHFSQFYSNPLYLAPSFAGSAEASRLVLNYRDQWVRIPGNFVSYSFSADHYFSKYRSGMGLLFFSDNAGQGKMVTTNAAFLYSFKLRVSYDFYLQPGISAYYQSKSINYASLNFADQFFNGEFIGTTTEVLPPQQSQHADFAFSLIGYNENSWGGFNINHLMAISPILRDDPRYSDIYVSVFGGTRFITKWTVQDKENEVIHVAFNFRNQSKINQLDLGGYFFKRPLYIGLWYRGIPIGNTYPTSDALIFSLGVSYNRMVFSYSYDMTLGYLISTTGGSHEVSLVYYFFKAKEYYSKRKKYRKIPCPDFLH